MKPKTMILMGLAITCGLGASYMTSRLLAERTTDEPQKVEILVASKPLSVHQRITNPEDLFVKKAYVKGEEPPDAITEFEALKGKTLKSGRNVGDHVTPANLYDKGQLEIPDGYQAVGVRVNVETTASGLASLPGSHVDLLLSVGSQDVRQSKAMVLLESVLVLAADIRVTPEGEIAAPAQVVTFGLKREDVLKVTAAKGMGMITLVLRNRDDKSKATKMEFTGGQIMDHGKQKEPEPVKVVVETPKPPPPPEKEDPKVIVSYYDIVSGSQTGPREVTRVHYRQFEDGTITIDRTELVESTRKSSSAPSKDGRAQDY